MTARNLVRDRTALGNNDPSDANRVPSLPEHCALGSVSSATQTDVIMKHVKRLFSCDKLADLLFENSEAQKNSDRGLAKELIPIFDPEPTLIPGQEQPVENEWSKAFVAAANKVIKKIKVQMKLNSSPRFIFMGEKNALDNGRKPDFVFCREHPGNGEEFTWGHVDLTG